MDFCVPISNGHINLQFIHFSPSSWQGSIYLFLNWPELHKADINYYWKQTFIKARSFQRPQIMQYFPISFVFPWSVILRFWSQFWRGTEVSRMSALASSAQTKEPHLGQMPTQVRRSLFRGLRNSRQPQHLSYPPCLHTGLSCSNPHPPPPAFMLHSEVNKKTSTCYSVIKAGVFLVAFYFYKIPF